MALSRLTRWFNQPKLPAVRPTIRLALEGLESREVPATFTVTNVLDAGGGSFRQAILDANATAGVDTIAFNIPAAGINTINLLSALPTVSEAVTIDGRTEAGFTNSPIIELNGTSAGTGVNGLVITGDGVTVRGLIISRFTGSGIVVLANTTNIQGNFIGTNAAGNAAFGNGVNGIQILGGSANNVIGGNTALDRNLISGNKSHGINVQGTGTDGNKITGNYIGTDITGSAAVGNTFDGIVVTLGATNTTIGGTTAALGNVISGNGRFGVDLLGPGTNLTTITANTIGLGVNVNVVANGSDGIYIAGGASNNTIGGTGLLSNVISGNKTHGIEITGSGTANNAVLNNRIGTDATGMVLRGNAFDGVVLASGASNTQIGNAALGNFISANGRNGISVLGIGSTANTIAANTIGLNNTGTAALSNVNDGVYVSGAANTTIGGIAGLGNVISGNGVHGIEITGNGTNGVTVSGNVIGLNTAGTVAASNKFDGIVVTGQASNVLIGGTTANTISGNGRFGITLLQSGANVTIQNNIIGLNLATTVAVGNQGGIYLIGGAEGVQIGGDAGKGNTISGNSLNGISVQASTRVQIQGNNIGVGTNGTSSFGNGGNGVFLGSGTTLSSVGSITTPTLRNIIAFNGGSGVVIGTGAAGGNIISSNSISDNVTAGITFSPVFPIATITLSTATVPNNTQLLATGVINGNVNTTYRVEVFASPAGGTQGKTFLGAIRATTNVGGFANFAGLVPYTIAQGTSITVTLVNLTTNNSTKFSNAISTV